MAGGPARRDDGRVEGRTGPQAGLPPRQLGPVGPVGPVWPGTGRRPLRSLVAGRWARRPPGSAPLRRRREDLLVGGVAAGLAARTGLDVMVVRLLFVLATLLSVGAPLYVLAWLLVPMVGEDTNIASRALIDRRGIALAAGLASALIIVLIIVSALGAGWLGNLGWPLVICVAGVALIWRNAPPDEQETMRRLAEPLLGATGGDAGPAGGHRRSVTILRAAAGVLMLGIGLGILLSGNEGAQLLRAFGGLILVIAAIAAILGPWWLRIARDLVVERRARLRAEERADMAARVHDSVLQTLALIQRNADQPQQVTQLARAQERELRSWLFGGATPGSVRGAGPDLTVTTMAAGVRLIQQEVEARHGVTVEAVTVGDCDLDDRLDALLAAAREATVNAAKWSGASEVAVFAEVEPDEVSLFVRDRGCGFDPGAVPGDRKGLAESIRARMARRGGSATIRSAPGQGTEVTLRMPRVPGKRQPSRA
jgi:signal transduction histidine kinase